MVLNFKRTPDIIFTCMARCTTKGVGKIIISSGSTILTVSSVSVWMLSKNFNTTIAFSVPQDASQRGEIDPTQCVYKPISGIHEYDQALVAV